MMASVLRRAHQYRRDILIAVLFAVIAGIASYQGAKLVDTVVFSWNALDVWFDSDIPRTAINMTTRISDRAHLHPLFSLTIYPPVYVLNRLIGVEKITAIRLVIAAMASLWLSMMFVLLRLAECRRFDAALFSLIGAASASAVFWFVVPETSSFASLSILPALGVAALAQRRRLPQLWYVIVSALTLSYTLTNWMVGIFAVIVNHPWKRFLQITAIAFCLVVMLWGVQKLVFPGASFLFCSAEDVIDESVFVLKSESGGLLHVARSFIFHTMIMPDIKVVDRVKERQDWSLMTTQPSPAGSGSLWGTVAVWVWPALLCMGLWGLVFGRNTRLRTVVGLALLGQLVLHLLYGIETFLYSLHFLPLLVVLAAMSTLTRFRPAALVLAGVLLLSCGMNNGMQFLKAIDFFKTFRPQYCKVQAQMQLSPSDQSPRSLECLVTAPGIRKFEKVYYGYGGSFSPAEHSFRVSVWITDRLGNLIVDSDTIPGERITEHGLYWNDKNEVPAIHTRTIFYQTKWYSTTPGCWELNLRKEHDIYDYVPMVVISHSGHTNGQIYSLDWDGQRLIINESCSVTIRPEPVDVYLGEEEPAGWINTHSEIKRWKGDHGRGFARFELDGSSNWQLTIENLVLFDEAHL